jgi:class 3 adenylate cyclase
MMRRSVSPGDALVFLGADAETDVRGILPTLRTPTLVIQRTDDEALPIGCGRYLRDRIPGAVLIELPGSNHAYVSPDQDQVLDEVERFVKSLRAEEAEFDRVLATVLFTDIVGSTERAAGLGDSAWRDLVERHHGAVRTMLARYRGLEVDTVGDGFFASFDGPARAVRCAQAIVEAVRSLGLEVRTGVHTGEVSTINGKVGGIAVNIGARVGALAGPGDVLVSSTVKDLTAGAGLTFQDAGVHELRGVPDRWHLYRVVDQP